MGICDILFFDGETHVKNAGLILAARYPRISIVHGANHVVAIFFLDVFSKIPAYVSPMNFAKKLCNIFGSTRHATTEIFNNHSKMINQGIKVGIIKNSDCR